MIATTECPASDKLRAFTLGQLAEEQSDVLYAHVSVCPECQSELETQIDGEDSLIAALRTPDDLAQFKAEPACDLAISKALAALSAIAEPPGGAVDPANPLPKSIGEYDIVGSLGHGGMGNVFLAQHTKLGRRVALKVLASHRLANPNMRERFESEMRAIGRLSHPNVVTAHDAREIDGTAVLVTEYIEGLDLSQLVARSGRLSVPDACEVVRKVAVALTYTHEQGFVHRDIKPSNIMLSRDGDVKLLDLGLARLQQGDDEHVDLTATGQAMGTADYIAPEQITDSRHVDIRADIYALGCTLFKLLTGRAPFADPEHTTSFAKMTAHVSTAPPKLARMFADAPAGLCGLLDSMLAKSTEHRPQLPGEVAQRISQFTAGANLKELATRALATSPSTHPARQSSSSPTATLRTQSFWKRPVSRITAVAAGFMGMVFGFCLGILVTITNPDGSKTVIELTEGSKVEISETPPMQIPPLEAAGTLLPTLSPADISKNNLKQFGLAFHNFHDAHRQLPGSVNIREGGLGSKNKTIQPFSWRVALLPFLENGELFQEYRFDEPWDSEHNLLLLDKMPPIFRSPHAPADQPVGNTNYFGFAGERSALGLKGGYPYSSFTDGTSNTILLVETVHSVPWTKPEDLPLENFVDVEAAVPFDGQGLNLLRADGSLDTMALPIDYGRLGKMITRNGGEVVLD